MIIQCQKCKMFFDDEFRTTICPHDTFPANDENDNFAHCQPESYLSPYAPNERDTAAATMAATATTTTIISQSSPFPVARITPRIEYIVNPNPNQCDPPTRGIEIAFSYDNYMAVRTVDNHEIGFVLSRDAALQLADLINLELRRNEFNLAE